MHAAQSFGRQLLAELALLDRVGLRLAAALEALDDSAADRLRGCTFSTSVVNEQPMRGVDRRARQSL